ncbi:hypothetical protein FRC10_005473, partial [Ceratobasidium sp. 414]
TRTQTQTQTQTTYHPTFNMASLTNALLEPEDLPGPGPLPSALGSHLEAIQYQRDLEIQYQQDLEARFQKRRPRKNT